MKRSFRIGLGGIVFVILIAALLWGLPYFIRLDAYRESIQSFLESAIGKEVQIETMRLSLWKGPQCYLTHVQIKDKDKEVPIFKAEKVSARIKIAPLFQRKVRLTSIIIDTAAIRYGPSEENPLFGSFLILSHLGRISPGDMSHIIPEETGQKEAPAFFSRFSFDPSDLQRIELRKGAIKIEEKRSSGESFQTRLEDLSLIIDREGEPSSFSIVGEASFPEDKGHLKIEGTWGGSQKSSGIPFHISLRGDRVHAGLFSKELSSLLGIKMESGQFSVTSEIQGILSDHMTLRGEGTFDGLSSKGPEGGADAQQTLQGFFSYHVKREKSIWKIEEIKIRMDHSTITISGKLDMKELMPILHFHIDGKDMEYVPLEKAWPLFHFQAPLPVKGGRLDVALNGALPLESFHLKEISGEAFLKDFEIPLESFGGSLKELTCHLKISKERLEIQDFLTILLGQQVYGQMMMTFRPLVEAKFAFDLFNGHLKGRLSFPGNQQENYVLKAELEGVDIHPFLSILSPEHQDIIHGTLKGQMQLKSANPFWKESIKNLFGQGDFKIENGKIATFGLLKQVSLLLNMMGGRGMGSEETPFEFLEGQIHLDREALKMKNIFMKSADILLKGAGMVRWDATIHFSFEASFSRDISREMVAAVPLLRHRLDARGKLSFPLRISGHITHPDVRLDLDKLLKQSTRKKILNKLRDFFRKR